VKERLQVPVYLQPCRATELSSAEGALRPALLDGLQALKAAVVPAGKGRRAAVGSYGVNADGALWGRPHFSGSEGRVCARREYM